MSKQCDGYPPGHVCPVRVPDDRRWCQSCRRTRQLEEIAKSPPIGMTRAAVVLQDLEAPTLACACGGDASSPHHTDSLTHRQWAWATGQPLEPVKAKSIRRIVEAMEANRGQEG